jgi:hypothetical protein
MMYQVFIVDNGTSMLPFWDVATFVLETLAKKLRGLDDDGLDLFFANGDKWNIVASSHSTHEHFKKAMNNARPMQDSKTDITERLTKIFDTYNNGTQAKRMTLIVLTDGVWEGTVFEEKIDKKIAEFVGKLEMKGHRSEERRFSIQFIRFGDDPKAIARLKRLDNDLKEKYKIS